MGSGGPSVVAEIGGGGGGLVERLSKKGNQRFLCQHQKHSYPKPMHVLILFYPWPDEGLPG